MGAARRGRDQDERRMEMGQVQRDRGKSQGEWDMEKKRIRVSAARFGGICTRLGQGRMGAGREQGGWNGHWTGHGIEQGQNAPDLGEQGRG